MIHSANPVRKDYSLFLLDSDLFSEHMPYIASFNQVSWIRKSSLHVLTSNIITFTGDSRFSCLHTALSDTWMLQIKYTQLRDMGEYQCQVNTEPKISISVFLSVTGNYDINIQQNRKSTENSN